MKTLIKKFKQHQEEKEKTKEKSNTDGHETPTHAIKTNKNENLVTCRTNNNRLVFNGDLLSLISKNKQAIENSLDDATTHDTKHATNLVVTNGQLKTNATLCSVGTSPTAPLSISALQATTLTKLASTTTPPAQMVKFPSSPTTTATLISTSIEPILNSTTNTPNHFTTTPIRLTATNADPGAMAASLNNLNRSQFASQKVIYLPTSSNTIQTQLKTTNDANNLVQKYVFYKKPSIPIIQQHLQSPSTVSPGLTFKPDDSNENSSKNFKFNLNQQFVNLPQASSMTKQILLNVPANLNKPQLPLKLLDNSYVVDAQVKSAPNGTVTSTYNHKNSQELATDSDERNSTSANKPTSQQSSKMSSGQGYENGKILLNDITLNNTNPIAFVRLDQVSHPPPVSEMHKNKKIKLVDINSTD